jgi:cell division protein FtsW (lipid II flippase)
MEAEETSMSMRMPKRADRKHLVVCLLLLLALLGMSVAMASHIHQKADTNESQCVLCMSCAQMVAVCTVVVLALLFTLVKEETFFEHESNVFVAWIAPIQRVRPPAAG